MKKRPIPEVLRARRKLCLELAEEALEYVLDCAVRRTKPDVDDLAAMFEVELRRRGPG